ncbi:hypothetical protein GCM10008986_01300 [Salinibacillus aidingensis]|uniref:Pilus assembly protein Flp/PilA n=1 Tax=Salinibacillus aidingensis TaxID=237684 RepID=A0ABP3KI39_9BACI
MNKLMQRLVKEEKGQGMTEYGLILGLIALVVVVALVTLGDELKAKFDSIVTSITNPDTITETTPDTTSSTN